MFWMPWVCVCVCVHVGWDRQEITGGDGLGGGKAGFKRGRGQIKFAPYREKGN